MPEFVTAIEIPPENADDWRWFVAAITHAALPPVEGAFGVQERARVQVAIEQGLAELFTRYQSERDEARAALRNLLDTYDLCEPHINDAFVHRQMRVGPYTGPTMRAELDAARALLA